MAKESQKTTQELEVEVRTSNPEIIYGITRELYWWRKLATGIYVIERGLHIESTRYTWKWEWHGMYQRQELLRDASAFLKMKNVVIYYLLF